MICSSQDWALHSLDISAAFLQGENLEREIFLKPPKDVCSPHEVWRLNRCIYGLNDASRAWYSKVRNTLTSLGGSVCSYDNCMFLWHDSLNNLDGMLVCHVDDFAFTGTKNFHDTVIGSLKKLLKISSHDTESFKYLCLDVTQDEREITILQDNYINSITPVVYIKSRASSDTADLTKDKVLQLKRFSGQMNWVASQT